MRLRSTKRKVMTGITAYMPYLVCPKCTDAVAGALPRPPGPVKCIRCEFEFQFLEEHIINGLVTHDEESNRWTPAEHKKS
jgi:hypothetical protein